MYIVVYIYIYIYIYIILACAVPGDVLAVHSVTHKRDPTKMRPSQRDVWEPPFGTPFCFLPYPPPLANLKFRSASRSAHPRI